MRVWVTVAAGCAIFAAAPVVAQTPRDLLTQASFGDRDRAQAMRRIEAALASTDATIRRTPGDVEAMVIRATALGYRAKLTGSRSDATASRKQFEALIAANPRNAEAQLGLGAWHLATINKAGTLLARAVMGANRGAGNRALDTGVALGGNRAFFPGLAALFRLKSDPADPRGRALAEIAAKAGTPTALDRVLQRAAAAVLIPLRAGNAGAVRATAEKLLPLGQVGS